MADPLSVSAPGAGQPSVRDEHGGREGKEERDAAPVTGPAHTLPVLLPEGMLRFACRECGRELEAPAEFAGVEGPCPLCGSQARAPSLAEAAAGAAAEAAEREVREAAPVPGGRRYGEMAADRMEAAERVGDVRGGELESGEEGNRDLVREHHRAARRLRWFDAALMAVFLLLVAAGGAAVVFTQARMDFPQPAPELSAGVVRRMEAVDRRRDQAVQAARGLLRELLGTAGNAEAAALVMPGGGERMAGLKYPLFPGAVAEDFEFIQARRIPETDRFLAVFEIAADPPVVVPVEETPAGPRLHGGALAQQLLGRFAAFVAAPGGTAGREEEFYVMLRPAQASAAGEFRRARPDLMEWQPVAVEPAFPADGAAGCVAALAPDSGAAAVFEKREHDAGLRPAVVRLAWRHPAGAAPFVELRAFVENAWGK